jgi:acyl dehydratase
VLPGVALLAFVMRALDETPALLERLGAAVQINNVKFVSPVLPGTALHVQLQAQGSGVGFEVQRDGLAVAKGLLTTVATPTPAPTP